MKNRMSLCEKCEESLRENNEVTVIGKFEGGGECQLCHRYRELKLLEYENRDAARNRRAREKNRERGPRPRDTRARYREPWKDW